MGQPFQTCEGAGGAALSRPVFAALYAAVALGGIGGTAILSVLPVLGRTVRIPDVLVGGIFALSAAAWAITSPLWARRSEKVGRRSLVITGLAGGAASMMLFGVVAWVGLAQIGPPLAIFAGLLLARGLNGLIASAATSGAQAYVADMTSVRDRTRMLARLASAVGLGTVLGPAIVPLFALVGISVVAALILIGLGNLVAIFAVMRAIPPDRPDPARLRDGAGGTIGWFDSRIGPFIGFGFVMLSAQAVNAAVLGFTLIDRYGGGLIAGQRLLSLALLGGAAATLFAQWVLIPVLRLRAGQLLMAAPVAIFLGNAIAWTSAGAFGVMAGFAVASLGYGLGRPGYTGGASLAVGPAGQGVVAGMTNSLTGACSVAAPMLALSVYGKAHGAPYLFNMVAGASLFAAALKLRSLRDAGRISTDPTVETP